MQLQLDDIKNIYILCRDQNEIKSRRMCLDLNALLKSSLIMMKCIKQGIKSTWI